MSTHTHSLPKPVARFVDATNAHDVARILETFADDALVNDQQREFWGTSAIRGLIEREIVGDKVTMEVTETRLRHGVFVVSAKIDGTYDKTGLPDPLILTFYFTTTDEKIGTLIIMLNKPVS